MRKPVFVIEEAVVGELEGHRDGRFEVSGNEIGNGSYIIQMEDGDRIGLLFRPIRGNRDKTRHASERQLRGCALPANFDFRKVLRA